MKISSKIILGIMIISLVSVFTVPYIYNTKINNVINEYKVDLEEKGISIQVKDSNDTYLNLQRKYIISIDDSTYFLNNLKTDLDDNMFLSAKNLLDGTIFYLSLNLKKYPFSQGDIATITLSELSNNIQKELNKEKIGRDLIDFIEKDGFLLALELDNFNIKEAKLKDVALKLNDGDKYLKYDINNFVIKFDSMKKFIVNMDKLSFRVEDKSFYTTFKVNSYKYEMNQKNDFNGNDKAFIKNISFNINQENNKNGKISFNLKDISTDSIVNEKNNTINSSSNMSIKNINVKINNQQIEFTDFETKVSVNEIDKELIKKILDSIEKGTIYKNNELHQSVKDFIHKGFSINLDKLEVGKSNITFINNKFEFGKISINSNIVINNNDINFNQKPTLQWLSYVSSKLNVEMTKKDILFIMKMLNLPNEYLGFVKIENEKAYINTKYKNNELFVNNKKVL